MLLFFSRPQEFSFVNLQFSFLFQIFFVSLFFWFWSSHKILKLYKLSNAFTWMNVAHSTPTIKYLSIYCLTECVKTNKFGSLLIKRVQASNFNVFATTINVNLICFVWPFRDSRLLSVVRIKVGVLHKIKFIDWIYARRKASYSTFVWIVVAMRMQFHIL